MTGDDDDDDGHRGRPSLDERLAELERDLVACVRRARNALQASGATRPGRRAALGRMEREVEDVLTASRNLVAREHM